MFDIRGVGTAQKPHAGGALDPPEMVFHGDAVWKPVNYSVVATDLGTVAVQYAVPVSLPEWELPEVPVPESPEHDALADRLRSVLSGWLERSASKGAVRRNLAIRWDRNNPRVGVDPDVCLIDSVPEGWETGAIDSLRIWLPGHRAPTLGIEIVSRSHPYKDYARVQDKYAAAGIRELWVYDPRRFGPKAFGGAPLLQIWALSPEGVLVCRYRGDHRAQSPLLGVWLSPEPADHLRLFETQDGQGEWLALHEEQRERAERERERATSMEAEVQRLRELLATK